jgi:CheY-like chemotaxis protein
MLKKILVVEDNNPFLIILCQFLSAEGYQVGSANNGEEALELLENDTFDVVVSDVSLPGINGYALLDQLRSRFANIPVILMSGDLTLAPSSMGPVGPNALLLKPFSLNELLHAIKSALKQDR